MRVAAAVALLLIVAACGSSEPAPVAVDTPAATATPAKQPQAGKAILDAGGVALGRTAATATRFAFGAARADVDKAAEAALGSPPERSAIGECGAGPMEFSEIGGLKLNYLDGKLVGWFAEADPATVTSDGIRPGTMLRDLQIARSAEFVDGSTLEGEFAYVAADGQTIGGFATGEGRDAKIQSLFAGTNCFFR